MRWYGGGMVCGSRPFIPSAYGRKEWKNCKEKKAKAESEPIRVGKVVDHRLRRGAVTEPQKRKLLN